MEAQQKSREPISGEVLQILLWYDIPEIVLVKAGLNEFVLAVSSGAESDGETIYYGASMAMRTLVDYQSQKFDLRFALSRSKMRRYWRFSYEPPAKKVLEVPVVASDERLHATIPDSGVFSRIHDEIEVVNQFIPDTKETFSLDGSWELGDFSQLYARMEDIYYILNDIRRWRQDGIDPGSKLAIAKAFEKPWRGGGSYRSFYSDVANDNQEYSQLRFGGIQYNSPGHVTIEAKKIAFDQFLRTLEYYSESVGESKKAYNALYRLMSESNLLRSDLRPFVADDLREALVHRSDELAEYLPGVSYLSLFEMAGRDNIVASKVLLSIYRRIEVLFKFFDEGRIGHPDIELN